MKNTGMVRRLDDLGRVVIPKELRNIRGIKEGDPIEIYVEGDMICLRKMPEKSCGICGGTDNLVEVDGTYICLEHAYKLLKRVEEVKRC